MKNKFVLFLCLMAIFSCGNPEKEKTNTSDSLVNDLPGDSLQHDPIPSDTLTLDSLKAENAFNKNDSQTYFILANYLADPEIEPTPVDVQQIDSTCAVLVYPTDEQIKAMQQEKGDDFMQIADTYSFYQGSAIEMLDSIDVGTISAEKRYLNFKGKKSRAWSLDIRKDGAPLWNLIFFNVGKEPEIISVTDLSREKIIEYFDKKGE